MSELSSVSLPVPGVRLACVAAGIRKADRPDVTLIEICEGATAAAVFTKNAFLRRAGHAVPKPFGERDASLDGD